MSFRPLGDRIFVRPQIQEEKTQGGLFIPTNIREEQQYAPVLAVGPDVKQPVAVGDTVLFGKYAGSKIEIDGQEVIILREPDLIAVKLAGLPL